MASVDLSFFDAIQTAMEEENALKENIRSAVREIDRINRNITAVLAAVHSSSDRIPTLCAQARIYFSDIQQQIKDLSTLVSPGQYYKFNGLWTGPVQQACYLATLIVYLETERLITVEELEGFFAVRVDLTNDMHEFKISLEEFLLGMVSITGELSRLAVNSVTSGDFNRPVRIGKFLKELYSGYQLLNLKNDTLRKRFDGIKYDIKKVEEIIYDLTVRKLIVSGQAQESTSTTAGVAATSQ
ncbi:hypothetical protein BGZ73_005706 [Actinomortierella ambigua]|nr:hypothetical protein BGZ73_005706 [Actinomortierella ambigua]